MIPAKRAGSCGMMVSLGRDTSYLAVTPASSPNPLTSRKLAKLELRVWTETHEARANRRVRSMTEAA